MAANGEGTASVGEARAIQDIVKGRPWPPAVKGFELEFGEDSTGDPAVWVWLMIDDDVSPSAEKIRELGYFSRDLQSAIIDAGLSRWPYVRFRTRQPAER